LLGARLGSVVTRVDRVVAAVLRDPSPRRWLAQHHLRWLAEASPDTFLDAVEADLRQAEPTIFALLRPVTSTHGRCERTELLWALELLAWEPRRFARVFAILARLSEVEISDNWANKPEASLGSLVRCWLPQTAASVAERVAAMGKFAATGSPVAWRLLLAQFPRVGHASPNVRPRWREVPAGAGDGPLTTDVRTTMLGKRIVDHDCTLALRLRQRGGDIAHCLANGVSRHDPGPMRRLFPPSGEPCSRLHDRRIEQLG